MSRRRHWMKKCVTLLPTAQKINAEKRITVLMVTHDLKRASSYADDIWVLEDGKVKQEAGKGDGQA